MKIGVLTNFSGLEREPLDEYMAGVGQILEERAFHAIWVPEHAVGFSKYDPRYRYPYSDDGVAPESLAHVGIIDPMSALTALAMRTSTLKLCTGIAILPQRNPLYFAKMGAAIDRLSRGRFVAGVGLGWSAQEFAALGVPFERRGARMDEYVQVVRTLWQEDISSFQGEYFSLPPCVHLPKPLQQPSPPIYIGGESDAALRRVARFGQGWVGFRMQPDALAPRIKRLREFLIHEGRTPSDVDIVVSPGDKPCDVEMLQRYADQHVSQVVVMCGAQNLQEFRDIADKLAESLGATAARL